MPEEKLSSPGEEDASRDAMGAVVEDESKRAHLDFLTSLVLIAISVSAILASIGYWLKQKVLFYESAGFMPVLVAGGLLLMAVKLLAESLKHDTVRGFAARLKRSLSATGRSVAVRKAMVGLSIFGFYVFFLLGRLSFALASFLALAAVLVYVHLDGKWRTALTMIVIAALSVAGIVGLFQYAFSVPMP